MFLLGAKDFAFWEGGNREGSIVSLNCWRLRLNFIGLFEDIFGDPVRNCNCEIT
jgi:hypothetical protein